MNRPLLRYHGGKWRLAPWILDLFPPHKVYVEPFGGGGSVLLRKGRALAEIYNDLDGEIVNVFRVMRDHGEELIEKLRFTPFAREEFDLSFDMVQDPIEQARRTVIRSFMGYGTTLTRTNTDGSIQGTGFRRLRRDAKTTAADWVGLPDEFYAIVKRLHGVVIENRDAILCMQDHDGEDTLHYVDPPYLPETRAAMTENWHRGYRFEMKTEDHVKLAAALHGLKGMVIVSGYPSELYDQLFCDWNRHSRRHHAVNGLERIEVVWTKNIPLNQFTFS